jgi:hypothetical protein
MFDTKNMAEIEKAIKTKKRDRSSFEYFSPEDVLALLDDDEDLSNLPDDIFGIPDIPHSLYSSLERMRNTFMTEHVTMHSTTNCAFISPCMAGGLKNYKLGFKCPVLSLPWELLEDSPVLEFDQTLFFTTDIKYRRLAYDKATTYIKNVVAVLEGQWLTLPGDTEQATTRPHTFYAMQSVCTNNAGQGLYLDVSQTKFKYLHDTLTTTKTPANCEIMSVLDENLKTEVLVVSVTKDVKAGDQLVINSLHRHEFYLQGRSRGRKLTWFNDVFPVELQFPTTA